MTTISGYHSLSKGRRRSNSRDKISILLRVGLSNLKPTVKTRFRTHLRDRQASKFPPLNPSLVAVLILWQWFLLMSAILLGLFLFALDNTILADIQPKIVTEFNSVDRVAWLAVAMMIPTLAMMLPNGQLFQTFNAKWLYISGVILFEIGSALCGGAPTMTFLIFARAIAGVGCTLIYTGSLVLITVNTSERERYASQILR